LFIGITQTEGSGGAGLLKFLKDRKSLTSETLNSTKVTKNLSIDILARFSPILPKVSNLFKNLCK
jgi:hypothetical protein